MGINSNPVVFSPSVHEQKRLPFPLDRADDVLDERHVVRTERLDPELHVRLLRSAVAFAVVAAHAGAHEVFPGVGAVTRFREDVVDLVGWICLINLAF